jgi:hypothetical protein
MKSAIDRALYSAREIEGTQPKIKHLIDTKVNAFKSQLF